MQNVHRHVVFVQMLAPEFRHNRIAQQIVEYRVASMAFPASLGESGLLSPERLSDPATFSRVGGRPVLPRSFASATRDGYHFQFDGLKCDQPARILTWLGTLCGGYVYSALPGDGAPLYAPSFALFSADDRIHVRTDGASPTRDDPTIDNTTPSTARDLTDGATPEDRRALGLAALHEQIALSDLRQVLAAEHIYFTMATRGYVSPEQLGDAANYARLSVRPLLDAYFAQPLRLGYRFQFTGGKRFPVVGDPDAFGPTFDSWSYSAVPVEPGPKGRRSFTIYSNSAIYVATEGRVATESDPMLSSLK